MRSRHRSGSGRWCLPRRALSVEYTCVMDTSTPPHASAPEPIDVGGGPGGDRRGGRVGSSCSHLLAGPRRYRERVCRHRVWRRAYGGATVEAVGLRDERVRAVRGTVPGVRNRPGPEARTRRRGLGGGEPLAAPRVSSEKENPAACAPGGARGPERASRVFRLRRNESGGRCGLLTPRVEHRAGLKRPLGGTKRSGTMHTIHRGREPCKTPGGGVNPRAPQQTPLEAYTRTRPQCVDPGCSGQHSTSAPEIIVVCRPVIQASLHRARILAVLAPVAGAPTRRERGVSMQVRGRKHRHCCGARVPCILLALTERGPGDLG